MKSVSFILVFIFLNLTSQIYANYFRDFRAYNDFDNDNEVEQEDEESFDDDTDQEFDARDAVDDSDFEGSDDSSSKDIWKRADKDFINLALELTNKHRKDHHAPPLEIDETLNKEAQAYADHESQTNVQKHSCGPCDKYGENLAFKASTGAIPKGLDAAKWAVKSWYDEVSLYDFKNPGGGDMHKWGHFTALVWKSSKKMGIGVAYGTKTSAKGSKMSTVYVVARYLPPGNMLTPAAMKANVLPA